MAAYPYSNSGMENSLVDVGQGSSQDTSDDVSGYTLGAEKGNKCNGSGENVCQSNSVVPSNSNSSDNRSEVAVQDSNEL